MAMADSSQIMVCGTEVAGACRSVPRSPLIRLLPQRAASVVPSGTCFTLDAVSGIAVIVLSVAVIVVIGSASAASNSVSPSRASLSSEAITANTLNPSQCVSLSLNRLRTGSGTISGTGQRELIPGSSGADSINGGNGRDCIVAGGGDDIINGGGGTDVCIGGAGTDVFTNCETVYQ